MNILATLFETVVTWRMLSIIALVVLLTALVYVYNFFFNSK